jgi:hypothetical protein
VLGAVALVALDLWLVHGEEIVASRGATVDAWWYVDSASRGYWGDPERPTAFVRLPAYPLWIALVRESGLRLRDAIELLQAAGGLAVGAALVRAGLAPGFGLLGAAAIALHPASFALNDSTHSDGFYAAFLHLAVAAMVLQLCTGRARHGVVSGLALAVLWHTREEGLLLLALLAAFAAIAFAVERGRGAASRAALRRAALGAGVAAAVLWASSLAVRAVNLRVFGVFASSEMASPALEGANRALLRIEPPEPAPRFVAVPRSARALGYEASPAFAELAPLLEGARGRAWERITRRQTGVEGEIGAGWLIWAIHDVSTVAGHHATRREAARFYARIADEIERACDEGALACRLVLSSLVDPDVAKWLPHVPASLVRVGGSFLDPGRRERESDGDVNASARALYDATTNRRPELTGEDAAARAPVARAVQRLLARAYPLAIAAGTALALAALALLALRRRAPAPALAGALVLLAVVVASRWALLGLLDASSWPTARPRYVFPVATLYACLLVAVVGCAVDALLSRSASRSQSPPASSPAT